MRCCFSKTVVYLWLLCFLMTTGKLQLGEFLAVAPVNVDLTFVFTVFAVFLAHRRLVTCVYLQLTTTTTTTTTNWHNTKLLQSDWSWTTYYAKKMGCNISFLPSPASRQTQGRRRKYQGPAKVTQPLPISSCIAKRRRVTKIFCSRRCTIMTRSLKFLQFEFTAQTK